MYISICFHTSDFVIFVFSLLFAPLALPNGPRNLVLSSVCKTCFA